MTMNKNEQINGQLRHLLTNLSGLAVMYGLLESEEATLWSQVIIIAGGIAIGMIGYVQSWKSKSNIQKEAEFIDKVLDRLEEKRIQKQNADGG